MNIVLGPLAADLVLVVGMGTLLLTDLVLPPGDKRLLGWGAVYTLLAAFLATFAIDISGEAVAGAYVGDDVPDLPLFQAVGFAISVPNGHPQIRKAAHHVTERGGGQGAASDVCRLILSARDAERTANKESC